MKELMARPENKARGEAVASFLKSVAKEVHALSSYRKFDEGKVLESRAAILKQKFASVAEVSVKTEDEAASDKILAAKAAKAMPGRPAILLE
jgi:hypothetical protein